ncbi:MAG: hypothetical protein MZV64_29650 [Ignavibacteriales bacterium]|nr:hypothetical protein [Ignavibacteriales bacterium]
MAEEEGDLRPLGDAELLRASGRRPAPRGIGDRHHRGINRNNSAGTAGRRRNCGRRSFSSRHFWRSER